MIIEKDFIKASRLNWKTTGTVISHEQLQIGCLMRIANSLELLNRREYLDRSEIIRLGGYLRRARATVRKLRKAKP